MVSKWRYKFFGGKMLRIVIITTVVFFYCSIQQLAQAQELEVECTDIPPYNTPFQCESYRDLQQCNGALLVLGGYCKQTCGRCENDMNGNDDNSNSIIITNEIQQNVSQPVKLPIDLLADIIRINTKGVHHRQGFQPIADCVDRNFLQNYDCQQLKEWEQCNENWLQESGMCEFTCEFCRLSQQQIIYQQQQQIWQQMQQTQETDVTENDQTTNSYQSSAPSALDENHAQDSATTINNYSQLMSELERRDQQQQQQRQQQANNANSSSAQNSTSQTSSPSPQDAPNPQQTISSRSPALWIPIEENVVILSIEDTYTKPKDQSQILQDQRLYSVLESSYAAPSSGAVSSSDLYKQEQQPTPICLFGNCISTQLLSYIEGEIPTASIQDYLQSQSGSNSTAIDGDTYSQQQQTGEELDQLVVQVASVRDDGIGISDVQEVESYNPEPNTYTLNDQQRTQDLLDEDKLPAPELEEEVSISSNNVPELNVVLSPVQEENYVDRVAKCSPLMSSIGRATFYKQLLLSLFSQKQSLFFR
eukprot:TRINITY_DN1889_c0_g1_i6.p1 TRINITY_DN1889_c0_g1~~TRINITY_DN1889_c0_g1_i6.p1  ORF type:complete len:533 (-),score=55.29 TRINITY_DN1889_c0_g1_i6:1760-3358(-)